MKPLFFPFTYLKQHDAEILLTCFKTFSFFTTSTEKELKTESPNIFNNPRINPIFMEDTELKPVFETLNEYKKWAMLNIGNLDSLKRLFRTRPYFTSDTGVANIKSEIGKRSAAWMLSSEENQIYDKNQAFLKSLLFLRLAHENDAEKEAINQELQSVVTEERKLFTELKGEMKKNASDKLMEDNKYDPGLLMTKERLNAWVHVLIKKCKYYDSKEPLLLVTTSRGIADYLDWAISDNGISPGTEKLGCIKNFKIYGKHCDFNIPWLDDLERIIQSAMSDGKFTKDLLNETDDECSYCADIKLYKIANFDIIKIFCSSKMHSSLETKTIKYKLQKNFSKKIFVCFISIKNKNT